MLKNVTPLATLQIGGKCFDEIQHNLDLLHDALICTNAKHWGRSYQQRGYDTLCGEFEKGKPRCLLRTQAGTGTVRELLLTTNIRRIVVA